MESRTIMEWAERMRINAISSATVLKPFRMISSVRESTEFFSMPLASTFMGSFMGSLSEIDNNVAVPIEMGSTVRWHHSGALIFLDHQRSVPRLSRQVGTTNNVGVDKVCCAEIHGPMADSTRWRCGKHLSGIEAWRDSWQHARSYPECDDLLGVVNGKS